MDTRCLILNSDPVFQDRVLGIFDLLADVELRIVRSLSEAICVLIREEFDLFAVEGEAPVAIEQAINARQHFPSLQIVCLLDNLGANPELMTQAREQKVSLLTATATVLRLRRQLRALISAAKNKAGPAAEGIDPCHCLVGNLNQFSAAEILQMSCMGQRSGRLTFMSGRGTGEIYLHHGMVRHAAYGSLEGETAVAEVFRWRQGRFFFEEGIISQVQTVNRPWAHLLIDNLQKLDETMQMVSVPNSR